MRIARFLDAGGTVRVGLVEGDRVRLATGSLLGGLTATSASLPLADVRLLAPIDPVNILAIGRNYKAHAEEWAGACRGHR